MPSRDRTGPDGKYVNCIPVKDEDLDLEDIDIVERAISRGYGRGRRGGTGLRNPRGQIRPRYDRK